MIEHILYLSIGAILVAFGVLAGALADRIRGNRRASSRAPRLAGTGTASDPLRIENDATATARGLDSLRDAGRRMRADVVLCLKSSGYTKAEAERAADACHSSETSTIEAWTRAALRRLAANLEARS